MDKLARFYPVNIRRYFEDGPSGMAELQELISDFACPGNPDVERFLKESAAEFTKKSQSVTYLVFSADEPELLGYFSIAIKPLTIGAEKVSKTVRRMLERVSKFDETTQTYTPAAYLIAQLGKNYTGGANERITGGELLSLAWDVIRSLQYAAGGVVAFVEAEEQEKLLEFYRQNYFWQFDRRMAIDPSGEPHELIQLLRILK